VNRLIFGKKRWYLLPPAFARYARKPVSDWLLEDLPSLAADARIPLFTCVQQPGEIVFVPRGWAHAVVNLVESVGIAAEVE
jgi:hypothetical protein